MKYLVTLDFRLHAQHNLASITYQRTLYCTYDWTHFTLYCWWIQCAYRHSGMWWICKVNGVYTRRTIYFRTEHCVDNKPMYILRFCTAISLVPTFLSIWWNDSDWLPIEWFDFLIWFSYKKNEDSSHVQNQL